MEIDHFLSLGIFIFGIVAVISVMLGSYYLGQRHYGRAKSEPYESGVVITGSARVRFPAHFYVIAMIFVVFDIETIILYLWAVDVGHLGWDGWLQALIFSSVLILGLLYIGRHDGFSFGPIMRKPRETDDE